MTTAGKHGSVQDLLPLEDIVEGVGAAVAAFFVMWGAFLYMSAAGSPHQMERGKSAIVNALVGFSIVLMARVIAGMVQDSIGA